MTQAVTFMSQSKLVLVHHSTSLAVLGTDESAILSAKVSRRKPPLHSLEYPDAEIVLGLVAPVGTDLESLRSRIRDHVTQFNYQIRVLKLSGLLDRLNPRSLGVKLQQAPEFDRIRTHMDAGDQLRSRAKR